MKFAGDLLKLAVGGGLGAGGVLLAQEMARQATPPYARAMTQEEHAKNNIGGTLAEYTKVKPEELALYEGLRQGLMAGEITGDQINQLAIEGKLPKRVITLLTDVHDWGTAEPQVPVERLRGEGGPWALR